MGIYNSIMPTIKDIASVIFPLAGLIVASLGLNTWRRQLEGNVKFELAQNLLRQTYKLRNSINKFRSRYKELELYQPNENELLSREEISFFTSRNDWHKRWDDVTDKLSEISLLLVESEVIFSKDINQLYDDIFTLCAKLFTDLEYYLDIINPQNKYNYFDNGNRSETKETLIKLKKHSFLRKETILMLVLKHH